jgi:hypothetical protein
MRVPSRRRSAAYSGDFATVCGVDRIRTVHHPANVAAIEMNRRLGYVDAA